VVFINEWMAANSRSLADPADGHYDDWFELYNPGTNAVDLAGYYLTDTLANRFKYRITTNGPHSIPPLGYLLVWADEDTAQNMLGGVPSTDLHVNFKLAAGGEQIGLFAADGAQIDAVTFGQQIDDVSLGRYPDGSANIVFLPGSASPRAPNFLSGGNAAPVLDSIGNKVVYLGQTLAFTATAHDADRPGQALTFSLDPVPPPGADITAGGVFRWTPLAAGTYSLTVRVTDNGTPPRSATETISVEVLPGLDFSHTALHGGRFEMTWATQPGMTYILDHKSDLGAPAWTPLWTNTAWGTSLSYTHSTAEAPQRFFRLRLQAGSGPF